MLRVLSALLVLALAACDRETPVQQRIAGADPDRGAALIRSYGCLTCHTVPGVPGPRGVVGPPLDRFAHRSLIAGIVANQPDTLVRWIMDPPSFAPQTGMPAMGISMQEAEHIAAYLYTLR